jgi:hypothetical protein
VLFKIGDYRVPFAVKLHRAAQHQPEGVLARMRMKIVLAAAFHNLRVHSHEIAAAHQNRFLDTVKLWRLVFEDLCFLSTVTSL